LLKAPAQCQRLILSLTADEKKAIIRQEERQERVATLWVEAIAVTRALETWRRDVVSSAEDRQRSMLVLLEEYARLPAGMLADWSDGCRVLQAERRGRLGLGKQQDLERREFTVRSSFAAEAFAKVQQHRTVFLRQATALLADVLKRQKIAMMEARWLSPASERGKLFGDAPLRTDVEESRSRHPVFVAAGGRALPNNRCLGHARHGFPTHDTRQMRLDRDHAATPPVGSTEANAAASTCLHSPSAADSSASRSAPPSPRKDAGFAAVARGPLPPLKVMKRDQALPRVACLAVPTRVVKVTIQDIEVSKKAAALREELRQLRAGKSPVKTSGV
jgi:hypothetical protein